MCYEPLRFSPIFRRFVNSRESRVGLPLTPLNLTTKSVCALAQSSLFCGVCLIALRSLAHSHKQHPPLCVFYTHSLPNKHPSHLEHNLEAEVPSRGLHKIPTPGQHRAVGHTRVLTPIGYIALQFDSGGGAQQCFLSSSLVFVSRSRLSLVVCLGDDNASSVVGARASASLVSSLSLSRRVCPLSHLKREKGARSPVALLLVLFGCLSSTGTRLKISSYREASIKISDPLSIIVSRSVVKFDELI